MSSVSPNTTIREYQKFIEKVYGPSNTRFFDIWDMFSNLLRFTMRGLKGIRKNNHEKVKVNLLIALCWFMSILNRFNINLEDEVWKSFPYSCSYCRNCPCSCKEEKVVEKRKLPIDNKKRPKTLEEFQNMFEKIYPSKNRTLEHAGVHLGEEIGEFSEAILNYRGGGYKELQFEKVKDEVADFFSCIIGVFNSLKVNIAKELSIMFNNNCHVCKRAPCECSFDVIMKFES